MLTSIILSENLDSLPVKRSVEIINNHSPQSHDHDDSVANHRNRSIDNNDDILEKTLVQTTDDNFEKSSLLENLSRTVTKTLVDDEISDLLSLDELSTDFVNYSMLII